MKEQDKQNLRKGLPIYIILALCIVAVVIVSINTSHLRKNQPLKKSITEGIAAHITKFETLDDVINARSTWEPILEDWLGKPFPSMQFTDLKGKPVNLPAENKDTIIVLWASWDPAGKMMIAPLKRLSEVVPEKELSIVTMSNEAVNEVRTFQDEYDIPFTAVSHQGKLPVPLSKAPAIPTVFFINKQGQITLIAHGLLPSKHLKAVIKLHNQP